MRKYIQLLIVMAGLMASAQEFKGIAVYESLTVRKDIPINTSGKMDPAREAMLKERLSKPVEATYTLTFDKTSSIYEQEQKLEAPVNGRVRPRSFVMGKTYKNLKDKIVLEEREIYGKEFLVTDSLRKTDWKLENETKKIGGYTCYKATRTITFDAPETDAPKDKPVDATTAWLRKDRVTTAWYTPEIPVSHGPSYYWGLPGLILEVSTEHTTLLCSKITLNPKDKVEIKIPGRGEKITREKFKETMRAKAEEMRDMRPEQGNGRRRN
jgi:GLPGLI family protein